MSFLSTDGAALRFIVVGEPHLLEGKYKGKAQVRIACPIVTDDGFSLFITGKRVFRKLASLEQKFKDHVFTVVRHGSEGDQDATYTVMVEKDTKMVSRLSAIRKKDMTADLLKEALEAALEVVNQ